MCVAYEGLLSLMLTLLPPDERGLPVLPVGTKTGRMDVPDGAEASAPLIPPPSSS